MLGLWQSAWVMNWTVQPQQGAQIAEPGLAPSDTTDNLRVNKRRNHEDGEAFRGQTQVADTWQLDNGPAGPMWCSSSGKDFAFRANRAHSRRREATWQRSQTTAARWSDGGLRWSGSTTTAVTIGETK